MADPVVDVAGLAKHIGGCAVVCDVTLRLLPGEVVGLVGANGGGKTTTLRLLAGLLRADAGDGQVLGAPLGRAPDRARLGYMTQRAGLYADLTVAENLRLRARLHGLEQTAVADSIAAFDLIAYAEQRFGRLSGGWARRAQFAATVMHRPRLLLLDEPTAGLDVGSKAAIWTAIEGAALAGCAVVVSTHDLAEAERLPRVMLYANGRAGTAEAPGAIAAAANVATLEAAVAAAAR